MRTTVALAALSSFFVVASVVACVSPGAFADTIRTISGPVLEGEITSRDGADPVVIQTASGRRRVPRDDVFEIEEGPSPQASLARGIDALDRDSTIEDYEALVVLARAHGLTREYRRLVSRLIDHGGDDDELALAYEHRHDIDDEAEGAFEAGEESDERAAFEARMSDEPWVDRALRIRYLEELAEFESRMNGSLLGRFRDALNDELDDLRKAALTFIANERRYVGGRIPAPGQDKVDELVAAVRELYEATADPAIFERDRRITVERDKLAARLDAYTDLGGMHANVLREETDATMKRLVATVDVHAAQLRRWHDVLEENTTAEGPNDDQARRCIRLINEYRMLVGRRVLAIHEDLCAASLGHVEDMREHGFFSHVSPVAGKKWHGDRALEAGYPSDYVSEAIAHGQASADIVVSRWKLSADHHRGLVQDREFVHIGAGHVEITWTYLMGATRWPPGSRRR